MSGNLFIDNKIKQIPITEAELMKTRFTWIYFLGFSCQSCDCFMIHLKKWKEIHKNRDTAWHCVLFCQLCLDSAEAIWMEVVLFCVPAWQSWAPQTLSLDLQLGIQASQVAQGVKYLPAMLETWVQSLGLEDPLEKERQPTPVFLPGEFHGQRSLAGYSPWSGKESNTTNTHTGIFFFLSPT